MKSWQVDSLALLLLLAAASSASAQSASGGEASKWGPHIDFEAKPGSKRNLGEGDLFVPLVQDERTLFFGNLRARFDDQSSREGNLGLGVRRMLESGWNVGGYGYLDRRKTENDNYFSQVTVGGELLGRDWDFRANAYLPQGDKVRDLGTSSTATVSANTVLVSSVTTEERALKGYDAEVGWRLPFFDVDAPRQLRVYAGGYQFKDDVTKLSGPRVRAEMTVAELPLLWDGAQLIANAEYQDDNVRGSQTFLSLRLRVPLGGKEPSRHVGYQERRMTAPVMRDVDIVAPVIARAPVVETATTLADGKAFTMVTSDAAPTGTDLQNALVAAGTNSTVVLSGTFNTGATTLGLQSGQTLAGSVTVRTPSGHTATLSGPATILSTSTGNTIIAPGNNTISGLTIDVTTSHDTAILLGASNYNILGNTITMTNTGTTVTGVSVSLNSNVVISGNSFTLRGGNFAQAVFFGTASTATVAGNSFDISGATVNNVPINYNSHVVFNAGSTSNVLISGSTCDGAQHAQGGSVGFTDGMTCR